MKMRIFVSIARALARKLRIRLLDEATSAPDDHTRSVVQDSLGKLSITRIPIAHCLNTVRNVFGRRRPTSRAGLLR